MKGQIEIVAGAVMLVVAMLMILLSAEAVSEESVTQESVVQTQVALTEFKTMTAMNAVLKSEDPSIRAHVRNPDGDPVEEMDRIQDIFVYNNDVDDSRNYYISIEDTDISYGNQPPIAKSIYLASPGGPKRMEVGTTR